MSSEQKIEERLINKLKELKYTYREDIRDKIELEKNFREHFQRLNQVQLTDAEFARLRDSIITPNVFTAATTLREINTFPREDGTPLHYTLVNIKDWCKNEFEVIRQVTINTEYSRHRYDVIVLINGVPVVQIELKDLQVTPKRAIEQIVKYKNDPGNGYRNSLLCFMQLFIVSNESNTYYFANNNDAHFSFHADERFLPIYQLADEKNKKITHLHDFADRFLTKCTLGHMISRYMVLVVSEEKLMIMRPYQIYAVKAIVDCIHQNRGNGYIWHTTGSGKTLTSFKTATLLKSNREIEKCIFVVDRKDLDKQTRDEFNKFQEGCVEENTNTETLVRRLLSESYADKVIVTTIQKLGLALDEQSKRNTQQKKKGRKTFKERLHPLRGKRVVFIFDECHRSQFGDNHQAIKEFFPQSQLFGFTGTPIFEKNATYKKIDGTEKTLATTTGIFEKELHAYTITHAIDDKNVLRFHIEYYAPQGKKNEPLVTGDITKIGVVDTILDKHNAVTDFKRFNALFATASINHAIEYYNLFKEMQRTRKEETPEYQPLNIACVFSPPAAGNKDTQQLQEDLLQEKEDNKEDPHKKKEALTSIIKDYNSQYGTHHRIDEFDRYYQDIQLRIKQQQYSNTDYPHENKIDVTIVVDMLLTGFDSKYLNTLYVDKNLKYHGLIQAFSRTNRVLNERKPYGNILDFRKQDKEVDEAITLFSGQDIQNPKEIWLVESASEVVEKLDKAVEELKVFMKTQGLECTPQDVNNLQGDNARADFINKFKEIQRLKVQLSQYTDMNEDDISNMEAIMPDATLQQFRSVYLEIAQRLKAQRDRSEEDHLIIDNLDTEYVLFSSVIIDYDYIMALLARYTQEPEKEKMNREELIGFLKSYSNLMEERDDIIAYIDTLTVGQGMSEAAIREGYQYFKEKQTNKILTELANRHGIMPEGLQGFVERTMDRMVFDGDHLSDLMAPLNLGWKDRSEKETALMKELKPLLEKMAKGRTISGLAVYDE